MTTIKCLKKHPFTLIWLLVIILAAVLMAFSTQDMINLIFWFIMLGFLNIAYIMGIYPMHRMAASIEAATDKIKGNSDALRTDLFSDALFNNEILDDSFNRYKADTDRLSAQGFRIHSDISLYINEDTVKDSCLRGFLVQIPGIMTGLGILGTFVGLTLGLSDFDASTADAMAASIPPLMDGIKIAFFTSIFGVIFSILFNLAHNSEEQYVEEAIDNFTEVFYQYVAPCTESDFTNDIVNEISAFRTETCELLKALIKSSDKKDNVS